MSDIRDMHPMSEFRVKAITIGLNLSWVVVVVLLIEGIRLNVISDPRAQASTIGVAGMLAALNLIKWESVGDRFIGGLLLWLWGAVMLVALGSALSVEELSQAMLGLYLALIVFVAVIGRTRTLMLVTFVTISSYLLIPVLQGHDRTVGSLIVPSIALGAMALATRITTIELANSLSTVVSQRDELARKEINFERLYEVSRTVSVGDSLDNVLPQLVGKIGTYLDCEVGLVMLPNQSGSSLEVVSPIWAAGHALEVAGYRVRLQSRDPLVQAFLRQSPTIISDIGTNRDDKGILGELGLDAAMVVSLRVERTVLGLMILGDKRGGPFTSRDLDDFEALAAPAALVLAQLDRYEMAAESSRRMEDLARMKSDFVSVVSHELRTPLTSIIGALATLARPELAPEAKAALELLDSARNQTDRLRRLIEDLLMVSRIENRALPQHPVEIALPTLISAVIDEIPGASDHTTIDVNDRVKSIEADIDHLHRILVNLIQNAYKYGNGTAIEITAIPRAGGQVSIAIADHGPGITETQRQAIFDRFTQLAPSATRSQGGAGLGLHIVKGLVDAMGGEIDLSETPGGGATFIVNLPRVPGSLPLTSIQVLD